MDARIQAALIAAAVTIFGVLLRDLFLTQAKSRSDRQQSDRQIYRSYAKPLSDAATSLLWRLSEILDAQRGADFLLDQNTRYERYKLLSSYYRLASLLGWVRALRRELQFLPVHRKDHIGPLRQALDQLEKALADGTDIEKQRADEIVHLWRLDIPKEKYVSFSVRVDTVFERAIQQNHVDRPSELDPVGQSALSDDLGSIARDFCSRGGPSASVVGETRSQLIDRISIREAWVYRDWQAGVGDFMITAAPPGAPRVYDVVGFAEFEARTSSADENTVRWVGRVARLFDGLDTTASSSVDARLEQIGNVHKATASLLITLARIEKDHAAQIGKDTLQEAARVRDS